MQSLNFDKVIIGGTLQALECAYSTGLPILCIPQPPNHLMTESLEIWKRLSFLLSLSGQMPLGGNARSLRISEEDSEIKCFTGNSKIVIASYKDAYVFDDLSVEGLPLPINQPKKEFLVLDWISVRRGQTHPYLFLEDLDNKFVKRIIFYQTERTPGSRNNKDACAISFLTERQLNSLDCSESYVFLKTRDMMMAAGIKGGKNGTQATTGKPAYLSLKLEVSHRQAIPIHKNQYADTATLKFAKTPKGSGKLWYNKHLENFLGSPYERGAYGGSKNPPRKTKIKKREVCSR
tara:strand:+ start:10701 stop:11573 length:873 start_codon:yes stop_codon:yes gene_type:complete